MLLFSSQVSPNPDKYARSFATIIKFSLTYKANLFVVFFGSVSGLCSFNQYAKLCMVMYHNSYFLCQRDVVAGLLYLKSFRSKAMQSEPSCTISR